MNAEMVNMTVGMAYAIFAVLVAGREGGSSRRPTWLCLLAGLFWPIWILALGLKDLTFGRTKENPDY